MADVVPFPRTGNRAEEKLWAEYMAAVSAFHSSLPEINIEIMRRCVETYDAYIAEFTKNGSDK